MDPLEVMTKKERHALRRQEKMGARDTASRNRRFKKIMVRAGWAALGLAVFGGLIWYVAAQPPVSEADIVSKSGMHWHSTLKIDVGGVPQEIPANIGIGAVHQPIHTHDEDSARGVLHMEFTGIVQTKDLALGNFFRNWGKDMRSFGSNMRMTVNGTENTDYENYVMHDGDVIELHYD